MLLLSQIAEGKIPKDQVLEMVKRLHIPGYEIARRHFDRALRKGIIAPDTYPGFYTQAQISEVIAQKWPDDISALRTKKPKLTLKDGFTKDDLRQLLASCDDMEGHHIIWVDHNGNVDITLLPAKLTPAGWGEMMEDKIKFRYETCQCGNEYVGFEAANNDKWVNELYNSLKKDWEENRKGYIDY